MGKIRDEAELRSSVKSSFFLSKYLTENQIEGIIGLLTPVYSEILKTDEIKKLHLEEFRKKKEQEIMTEAMKIAEKKLEEKKKMLSKKSKKKDKSWKN